MGRIKAFQVRNYRAAGLRVSWRFQMKVKPRENCYQLFAEIEHLLGLGA
jgi:hypothetical protein